MPVTDVRVTLRVASSDHLRPRGVEGTAISVAATILDEDDAPVPGAVARLAWVTPDGLMLRTEPMTANAAGLVAGVLLIPATGAFVARAEVQMPIARVTERRFEMVAGAVALDADPATPAATPDGVLLVMSNGLVIGGVL